MRKFIKKLHLYVALAFFIPLMLQAATGMFLVFEDEINEYSLSKKVAGEKIRYLDREAFLVPNFSVSKVMDAVNANFAEKPKINSIRFEENGLVKARINKGEEVILDSVSLEIIEHKDSKKNIFSLVKKFHTNLLIDAPWSHNFIGFVGVTLLFLSITGIIIWWPKNRDKWRSAYKFSFKDIGYKFQKDMHKAVGCWIFITLTAASFSGIYLVFKSPQKPVSLEVVSDKKITPDAAIEIAKDSVEKDLRLSGIMIPTKPEMPYRISFDNGTKVGQFFVLVNPYNGEIVKINDPKNLTASDKFWAAQHSIHTGEILGISGKILAFITAITPFIFIYSGIYMWWMKKKNKRHN